MEENIRSFQNSNFSVAGYDFRRNLDLECRDRGMYVTDLLSQEAERVIFNHDTKEPLFMVLAHLAGHTGNEDKPLQAPIDEINKFKYISDPDRRTYAGKLYLYIYIILNA